MPNKALYAFQEGDVTYTGLFWGILSKDETFEREQKALLWYFIIVTQLTRNVF